MSKKRKPYVPRPGGRGEVGPILECHSDAIIAGAPMCPVDEFDPVTGMMRPMDPQPPHPFPEAAAAYAAAQAAKAPPPPAEPPA